MTWIVSYAIRMEHAEAKLAYTIALCSPNDAIRMEHAEAKNVLSHASLFRPYAIRMEHAEAKCVRWTWVYWEAAMQSAWSTLRQSSAIGTLLRLP